MVLGHCVFCGAWGRTAAVDLETSVCVAGSLCKECELTGAMLVIAKTNS